jgi:hypothetical protein
VPARVGGVWQTQLTVRGKPVAYELRLDQEFQMVTGSAHVGGRMVPLRNARLQGEQLTFEFTAEVGGSPVRHEFNGKVSGGVIHGVADLSGPRMQGRMEWNAKRVESAADPMRGAPVRIAERERN